jgi:long-chain acyl-CoA synthetase
VPVNLMMLLEMAADGFGDRVAVGSHDGGMTYRQLYERAGAGAAVLRELGVERVAFLDVNGEAFPVALFASAWAGLPFVPLNYRLSDAALRELLAQVDPAVVIEEDREVPAMAGAAKVSLTRSGFLLAVDQVLAAGQALEPGTWSYDGDDVAVLLYTSGTTSAPKAAILRHRHLVSYILSTVEFMGADDGDAALMTVPPYHVAGVSGVLSNLYAGRRLVPLANFTPEGWLQLARAEQVTNALLVPTMLARIVEHLVEHHGEELPESAQVPTLRHLGYGGAKMPPSVIEKALRLFPTCDFVNAYGLTETSSTIAVLGPADHREAFASDDPGVRARLGSAGVPLPGVEVEIRDDEGNPVGPGVAGEIFLRGEQISGEYVGRAPQRTDDGWFPTRDRGWLDDGGYLFVEGRADDTIIRGGENIAPAEIEECLMRHEAVLEAAVVGVPDEQWGECIAAVVVLREGEGATVEQLRDHVRSCLRSSKTPDRIEFRPELPYTDTGKLLRRQVLADLTGG